MSDFFMPYVACGCGFVGKKLPVQAHQHQKRGDNPACRAELAEITEQEFVARVQDGAPTSDAMRKRYGKPKHDDPPPPPPAPPSADLLMTADLPIANPFDDDEVEAAEAANPGVEVVPAVPVVGGVRAQARTPQPDKAPMVAVPQPSVATAPQTLTMKTYELWDLMRFHYGITQEFAEFVEDCVELAVTQKTGRKLAFVPVSTIPAEVLV